MKQCIGIGLRGPEGLGSIIRDRTRHSPASASSREKEKIEEEEEEKKKLDTTFFNKESQFFT